MVMWFWMWPKREGKWVWWAVFGYFKAHWNIQRQPLQPNGSNGMWNACRYCKCGYRLAKVDAAWAEATDSWNEILYLRVCSKLCPNNLRRHIFAWMYIFHFFIFKPFPFITGTAVVNKNVENVGSESDPSNFISFNDFSKLIKILKT